MLRKSILRPSLHCTTHESYYMWALLFFLANSPNHCLFAFLRRYNCEVKSFLQLQIDHSDTVVFNSLHLHSRDSLAHLFATHVLLRIYKPLLCKHTIYTVLLNELNFSSRANCLSINVCYGSNLTIFSKYRRSDFLTHCHWCEILAQEAQQGHFLLPSSCIGKLSPCPHYNTFCYFCDFDFHAQGNI